MSWWGILKAPIEYLPSGSSPQQQLDRTQQQQIIPQQPTSGNVPSGQPSQTFSNIAQRIPQQNTTGQTPMQQAGQQSGQMSMFPRNKPVEQQETVVQPQQTPQPVQTQVAEGGEDDSDVGDVRANIAQVKQNLTQLPRGPKAKQLTQILTLLSQAAIDPVKQRETALQAKKILQQTFPMNA
jgi:hypothetical protein